jgi:hypothetical protein
MAKLHKNLREMFSPSLPPLQRLSRLFSLLLISMIVVLCLFGRKIADSFSGFVLLAPVAGVIILIAVIIASVRHAPSPSTEVTHSKTRSAALKRLLVLSSIVVVALITITELLIVDPIERIHFVKYGLLTTLLYFSQSPKSFWRQLSLAALLAASIGTLDECMQYFVPRRVFDLRDIVLNLTGTGVGIASVSLIRRWQIALKPER